MIYYLTIDRTADKPVSDVTAFEDVDDLRSYLDSHDEWFAGEPQLIDELIACDVVEFSHDCIVQLVRFGESEEETVVDIKPAGVVVDEIELDADDVEAMAVEAADKAARRAGASIADTGSATTTGPDSGNATITEADLPVEYGDMAWFISEAFGYLQVSRVSEDGEAARFLLICDEQKSEFTGSAGEIVSELSDCEAVPAKGIHVFGFTGSAYDACQCDESVKTGDCLVIEEERVVGLAWAWPLAITVEKGHLHCDDGGDGAWERILADAGITDEQVDVAVAEAKRLGFELRETFAAYLAQRDAAKIEQIGCSSALQIARDVLLHRIGESECMASTPADIKSCIATLSAIIDQRGLEDMDPAVSDGKLTTFMDLAIFG